MKKRDWREFEQLEPVLEEIRRLKSIIDTYEDASADQGDSDTVLDLKAKLQALMEERTTLYQGQSATASKLLDLNERLETVSKERDECRKCAQELERQVRELQGIVLRGEFENVLPTTTLQVQPLLPVLVGGVMHGDSYFGWTGTDFVINNLPLPTITATPPSGLYCLSEQLAIAHLTDNNIILWTRTSNRIKYTLSVHQKVISLALQDDLLMATVHADSVKLWDLTHGTCIRTITSRMDDRAWVHLQDERIFTVLARGKLKVFSRDGELIKNTQLCKSIANCSFSNNWMVVWTGDAVQSYKALKLVVRTESARGVRMLRVDDSGSITQLCEMEGKWCVKKGAYTTVLDTKEGPLDLHLNSVLFPDRLIHFTNNQ